jgi:hypothetical protein
MIRFRLYAARCSQHLRCAAAINDPQLALLFRNWLNAPCSHYCCRELPFLELCCHPVFVFLTPIILLPVYASRCPEGSSMTLTPQSLKLNLCFFSDCLEMRARSTNPDQTGPINTLTLYSGQQSQHCAYIVGFYASSAHFSVYLLSFYCRLKVRKLRLVFYI